MFIFPERRGEVEMLDSFQVRNDIHRGAKWERKKLGCISASAPRQAGRSAGLGQGAPKQKGKEAELVLWAMGSH